MAEMVKNVVLILGNYYHPLVTWHVVGEWLPPADITLWVELTPLADMTWHMSHNMWHATPDMWQVTSDGWHVIGDMWQVTCDRWHVTGDMSCRCWPPCRRWRLRTRWDGPALSGPGWSQISFGTLPLFENDPCPASPGGWTGTFAAGDNIAILQLNTFHWNSNFLCVFMNFGFLVY